MMVTSLHPALKNSSIDELLVKTQSRDSETDQGLSFGQILNLEEKKLQQERSLNTPSVAAALAAMQTPPAAVPVVDQGATEGKQVTGSSQSISSVTGAGDNPGSITSGLPAAGNSVQNLTTSQGSNASSLPLTGFAIPNGSMTESAGVDNGKVQNPDVQASQPSFSQTGSMVAAGETNPVASQINSISAVNTTPLGIVIDPALNPYNSPVVAPVDGEKVSKPQNVVGQPAAEINETTIVSATGGIPLVTAGDGINEPVAKAPVVNLSPTPEIETQTSDSSAKVDVQTSSTLESAESLPMSRSAQTTSIAEPAANTSKPLGTAGTVSITNESQPKVTNANLTAPDTASEVNPVVVNAAVVPTVIESQPQVENVNPGTADMEGSTKPVQVTSGVVTTDSNELSAKLNVENTRQSTAAEPASVPVPAQQPVSAAGIDSAKFAKIQPAQQVSTAAAAEPAVKAAYSEEKTQKAKLEIETTSPAPALSTTAGTDTANVKVAEKATVTQLNTHSADIVQQIMSQLNARIKGGPASMHLQLNPKELGAIDVQMVTSAQGVNVTFLTENPSTGRLLETQMNQLRQSLSDAGIQLSGLNVGQHNQPRQEGGQNPYFSQTRPVDALLKDTVKKEPQRPERIIGPLGEVDYLV